MRATRRFGPANRNVVVFHAELPPGPGGTMNSAESDDAFFDQPQG